MNKQADRIKWWDQDILNIAFRNNWQEMSIYYNLTGPARAAIPEEPLLSNGCLIHYTGRDKPWNCKHDDFFHDAWRETYEEVFSEKYEFIQPLKQKIEDLKAPIKDVLKALKQFTT